MARRIVVGTFLLGSVVAGSLAHAQGNHTTDEDWPALPPTSAPPPTTATPPPPATTSAPPAAPPPSQPSTAAPPTSPATSSAAQQPEQTGPDGARPASTEAPERKSSSHVGVGIGYAATWPVGASSSRSASGVGLVLEVGKTIPLAERVDFGLRFAWGLTEWDRFTRWAKAGYDAGSWTTQAYEDVYNWTRKRGEDGDLSPNTHGLRLMGSFFAFMALSLGYVVSGLAYASAIVAPTTWLELDLTASYNFGDKQLDPYLKGGLGFMAFVHPEYDRLLGALGPTFGTGVRIGTINLGANGTWSPPMLHGEARPGSTHILVGGLTLGVQN